MQKSITTCSTILISALLLYVVSASTGFGQPEHPEHPTTQPAQPEHPAGQEHPAAPAELTAEQQWLKQLVGEWHADFKMFMDPEQPPMEAEGTENIRAIGDFWTVSETNMTVSGQPFAGMLSLGWDPQKQHYVATWIDSMGGHLWTYKGTMNEARDTLTLETEGPSMEVPDTTARYKEYIKITGDNTRTFTSTIETADGTGWMTIMSAEYTRKE